MKGNAVIYIRVSDPSQIENNSLGTQLKSCEAFAKDNGYKVVKVFREEGISAKHIHTRPEMQKLLELCTLKKNQISAVIVYKMDRWTRNVEDGLVAISMLARSGVAVIPATEIADQNPEGKAMRTILMALAELDNGLKGKRVRDNMKTMFNGGLWCWKARIGYKRPFKTKEENKGKPMVVDGRLGEIIQALFIKAAETQVSKKYLADYVNGLGFGAAYGTKADGRFVARILKDTFYYGYMYAPKWKEYAWGKHKPLIDQNTWERANINVFGRKRKYKSQDNNTFVLKGLIKCSSCGHELTSSNPMGTSKHYLYYECHNKPCENRTRIPLDLAHKEFLEILASIKPSERVLKMFINLVFSEWDVSINESKREIAILDQQIQNLEDKLTSVAEGVSKHILTEEEALKSTDKIRKEIIPLKIARSDIHIEQYNTEIVKNFTEDFLVNIDKLWLKIDLPHKQTLQSSIFPEGIQAEKSKIGIVKLSSSFGLIKQLKQANIDLVTPREIESRLPE